MELYTSGQVAALFQVTTETIRLWAQEFAQFLSVSANPGGSRSRRFVEEDLSVLALIAEFRSLGKNFDDIQVALANGQRGTLPQVSMDKLATLNSQDVQVITAQVQRLQIELRHVQEERDALLQKLATLHELEIEKARLQSERDAEKRRADQAEARVQELTDRLIALQMETGQARGELAAMLRVLKMRGELSDDD